MVVPRYKTFAPFVITENFILLFAKKAGERKSVQMY
jgi:hypothetical protein